MFSLMIVEDELFMSDFLANFIDWTSIGVELAGVYHDGESALAAIIEKTPNVVLTDINMPVMSGLELIEKVQEKNIKTKFVIISGYNDFYLVKNAFLLGATDYFLKTELDPTELKNFILKMKFTDEEYRSKNGIEKKEPALREIVWGMRPLADYAEMSLHIFRYKLVLAVNLINYSDVLKNQFQGDKELLKYGIMNILDEVLESAPFAECFFEDNDQLAFIVSDDDKDKARQNVDILADIVRGSLDKSLKFITSAGFCGIEESERELARLYNKARQAAKFSFVRGREPVYDFKKLESEAPKLKADKSKLIIEFENLVFDFDFDKLGSNLDSFIIKDVAICELDRLNEIYRSYFMVLMHFSNKYQEVCFDTERFEKIIRSGTLDELNGYFSEIISKLAELFGYSSNIAARAQKYIQENFDKDISLQSIADEFQIDYKKLSRLFMQKTGGNFKKYLIDIRMREAMRLIKETDFLLYEIAEMVGYNNYANFSRSFMKYYNKWPKDVERG